MAQHVAVLRAGPKAAGAAARRHHQVYVSAPPTQEAGSPGPRPTGARGATAAVGSYLVRYADGGRACGRRDDGVFMVEESTRLASMASTRTRRLGAVDASRRRAAAPLPLCQTRRRGDLRGLRPRHGSPDIGHVDRDCADLENRGSSFCVHTPPERSPYAPTWKRSAPGSRLCERPASRCTTPKNSRPRPRPSRRWLLVIRSGPAPVQAHAPDPGFVKMHGLRRAGRARQVAQEGLPEFQRRSPASCVHRSRVIARCRGSFFFEFEAIRTDAPHRRASTRTSSSTASCSRILLRVNRASPPTACYGATDLVYGSSERS